LIISWPDKVKEPFSYNHLVSLTDLFSTFIEMTGQTQNVDQADSYSFLHVLNGNINTPVRPHMIHHSSKGMFAIRRGECKFIDGLGSDGFTEPATIKPDPG